MFKPCMFGLQHWAGLWLPSSASVPSEFIPWDAKPLRPVVGRSGPKGAEQGTGGTPGSLAIDPAASWLPLSRTLASVGHTKQDKGMPVSREP